MNESDKLLTRAQAAARLSVTTRTLDRWRRSGFVKSVVVGKVVRFRPADLADAVRRALT